MTVPSGRVTACSPAGGGEGRADWNWQPLPRAAALAPGAVGGEGSDGIGGSGTLGVCGSGGVGRVGSCGRPGGVGSDGRLGRPASPAAGGPATFTPHGRGAMPGIAA